MADSSNPDVNAQLEAERQRQIQDRLLVREYAVKAYNDQDRDYEHMCDDGVNNWLGDHLVPKMYRTEEEARGLAAQAVRSPAFAVGLTDRQKADMVTAFRRQGETWRTRLAADLRSTREDNPALRSSYVEELITRLSNPAAPVTEEAPQQQLNLSPTPPAPPAPAPASRIVQVMTGLTLRLPVGMPANGMEEAVRRRVNDALLRAAREAGAEISGGIATVVHMTRD